MVIFIAASSQQGTSDLDISPGVQGEDHQRHGPGGERLEWPHCLLDLGWPRLG